MADDIKITPAGNGSTGSQNPAAATAQNASQSGGGQGAGQGGGQGAGQGSVQGGGQGAGGASGDLNPVIDLRNIDQKPAAQSPQGQGAAVAGQGAAGRRSNAIMLGDDDDDAAQPKTADKYPVPALVKEKFPDLIQLIKETESMNAEERDYWFQILPIMTEDQIKKFRDILVNEKSQLANLDKEYEQELTKLNEKHMIEWKEFETKEKRKSIASAEQASKDKEKQDEEDLLKRLSQV